MELCTRNGSTGAPHLARFLRDVGYHERFRFRPLRSKTSRLAVVVIPMNCHPDRSVA
jgi:hypothetical protein